MNENIKTFYYTLIILFLSFFILPEIEVSGDNVTNVSVSGTCGSSTIGSNSSGTNYDDVVCDHCKGRGNYHINGMNECALECVADEIGYVTLNGTDYNYDKKTVIEYYYIATRIDAWVGSNDSWIRVSALGNNKICPGVNISYTQYINIPDDIQNKSNLKITAKNVDYGNIPDVVDFSESVKDFWQTWQAMDLTISSESTEREGNYVKFNVSIENLRTNTPKSLGYNGSSEIGVLYNQSRGYHYWVPILIIYEYDNEDYNPCGDIKSIVENVDECCDASKHPESANSEACCKYKSEVKQGVWQDEICCSPQDTVTFPNGITVFTFLHYDKEKFKKLCDSPVIIQNDCSDTGFFNANKGTCCTSSEDIFSKNTSVCCNSVNESHSYYNKYCSTPVQNDCSDTGFFEDNKDTCCTSSEDIFSKNTNVCCNSVDESHSYYNKYCKTPCNPGDSICPNPTIEDITTSCKKNTNYEIITEYNGGRSSKIKEYYKIDTLWSTTNLETNSGQGFDVTLSITDTIVTPSKPNRDNYEIFNNNIEYLKTQLKNNSYNNDEAILINRADGHEYEMKKENISYTNNTAVQSIKNATKVNTCLEYGTKDDGTYGCIFSQSVYTVWNKSISLKYDLVLPDVYIDLNNQSVKFTSTKETVSNGKKVMTNVSQRTGYYYFDVKLRKAGILDLTTTDDSNIYTCQYLLTNEIEDSITEYTDIAEDLNYYFRSISLQNPFPNRLSGPNWYGYSNIDIDEEKQDKYITNKDIDYSNPMYEITLTSNMIKALQKYNEQVKSYSNQTIIPNNITNNENKLGGTSKILNCLADGNDCDTDMQNLKGLAKDNLKLPNSDIRGDTTGDLTTEEKEGV